MPTAAVLSLALLLAPASALPAPALPAPAAASEPTPRQPLFGSSAPAPCGGVDPTPARYETLGKWLGLVEIFGDFAKNASVTYDEMIKITLDQGITTEDYTFTLTGGVVGHVELERMPIYLSAIYPFMNLQTMKLGASEAEGNKVTIDGDTFSFSAAFDTWHADKRYIVPWWNTSARLTFAECSALIQYERRQPDIGSLQTFMWNVDHSTYLGSFAICAYHDAYCTGEYRQYESFDACISYLESVPTVSARCGRDKPGAGFSKGCMYIAKWSVPWRPERCFSLGPEYNADGALNLGPDSEYRMCKEDDCDRHEPLKEAPYDIPEPGADYLEAIAAYEKDLEDKHGLSLDNYRNFPFPAGAPKPSNPSWDM